MKRKTVAHRSKSRTLLVVRRSEHEELNALLRLAITGLVEAVIKAHVNLGGARVTHVSEKISIPTDDGSALEKIDTSETTIYITGKSNVMSVLLAEGESCAVH